MEQGVLILSAHMLGLVKEYAKEHLRKMTETGLYAGVENKIQCNPTIMIAKSVCQAC